MIFQLKKDIMPNYYIIVGPSGNIIAGPNRFECLDKAVQWGENFVSSFRGAKLEVNL